MPERSIRGNEVPIHVVGVNAVVRFSAEDLARYLEKMTGVKHSIAIADARMSEGGIYLGTADGLEELHIPICKSSEWEDTIVLKTIGKKLFITGSNPRSVLFATYRYLELLGAEWLWPGGEVLPEVESARTDGFDLKERASYRHRGVCIEGAVSPGMVMDFIDWMAKRRMNEFFLQFKTSQYFYNRYYARRYNPLSKPLPEISIEEALNADARVIEELKRRGLIVEGVGHGWTCEALGIRGLGWDVEKRPLSEGQRALTALVGGKRGLFGGIAVNTELCYSNPRAFDALVSHVVQYAADHPKVDILHFWLSDGMNNHCECPDCQKLSPSDWYVKLINAISHQLVERDLKTQLVFLCYANTLWAPEKEVLGSEDGKVIFMFAPITRCYLHPLADARCSGSAAMKPPPRNGMVPPRTNHEFVQLLRGWQGSLPRCDSFLFDYHFWTIFGLDFLTGDIGAVLWKDIRDLRELHLNGLLSCQTLRAFYPTGMPMATLAETLWNDGVDLQDIKGRYLRAAFGDDYAFVSDYLERIYSFVDPGRSYEHGAILQVPGRDKVLALLQFVKDCHPRIERMAHASGDEVRRKSALHLLHHNTHVMLLLEAIAQELGGEREEALRSIDRALEHFQSTEDEVLNVADAYLVSEALNDLSSRIRSGALRVQ
jgi:hypothetical protein